MSQPPRTNRRIYPIIMVAATLVVFGSLATAEFTSWDDRYNIWLNARLNPPTWSGVAHYWANAEAGLYIPLTYTVWSALATIAYLDQPDAMGARLNPMVFHCANIAFHLVSGLVVYWILVRLLGDRRASCAGALLFALHPVQVEAVAWCAGMKDVLSGMLGLISIWQYVLFAQLGGPSRHYSLASACFVLAMLAKPSAMVVPAIAMAIDTLLIGRAPRVALRVLLPWIALSVGCAVLTRINQPALGVTAAPLWSRPLVALDALAFYLYKLVWPIDLGIDYGRRPQFVMSQGSIWFTWLLPAAVGALVMLNRRRWSELVVGAVIFVLGVAPVLGLVTFLFQHYSTTADHYLYLSMLGVGLCGAWLARRLLATRAAAVVWIVLVVLGVRSALQTRVWHDDVQLLSHALDVNPRSFVSANNLGHAVLERGEPDRAEGLFRRAIELDDRYVDARENLASLLEATGRLNEAIEHRLIALSLRLARPPAIRGNVLEKRVYLIRDLIEVQRLAEAREQLEQARRDAGGNLVIIDLLDELQEKLRQASTAPATDR
jgi:hypothetical protein